MRRLAAFILISGLSLPIVAHAGVKTPPPGYTASVEQGVTVYRGEASAQNFQYVKQQRQLYTQQRQRAKLKSRIFQQQRQIAAQKKAISALEMRLSKVEERRTQKTVRRSRYGRSYYGNPRFFGPNGFRGNRHYGGATVPTNIRVHRPRRRGR